MNGSSIKKGKTHTNLGDPSVTRQVDLSLLKTIIWRVQLQLENRIRKNSNSSKSLKELLHLLPLIS